MNNVTDKEVIDTQILKEYTPELINRLITMFQEQAPQSIAKLKGYATEQNAVQIGKEAHYLKGSSAALGGTQLTAICKELQLKGEQGDLSDIDALLEQLERSYTQSLAILQRLC
ncbi:MAG: Hpt domain-containing protein [Candidatus Competibacteraceae bacterium]|jgi:HPt (histidine-containing phosphotransfer) domain-containing protein|nr:Hpt domain-containing protein [Candidatus Competibacteraceae bacterium]